LVDETLVRGVLAGRLPGDAAAIRGVVRPQWLQEPLLSAIEVQLDCRVRGSRWSYVQTYSVGRWTRRSMAMAQQLRQHGVLAGGQTVYLWLLALRDGPQRLALPQLAPPRIAAGSLAELGIGRIDRQPFDPQQPVLVSAAAEEDMLRATEEAGVQETGGAALGQIVDLAEPLTGAETSIVTVLTACVPDTRHKGEVAEVAFSPEAMVDADAAAQQRGRGESVIAAFHSHGWSTKCGDCNQSDTCAIPQCDKVSLQDYDVVESLLPSKATLMPITGRKLGAPGKRPVLEVHAWRGGQLKPIRWTRYSPAG
jgi:hypothetical protein